MLYTRGVLQLTQKIWSLCTGFAPVLLRRGIPYKDSPGTVLAGVVLGGVLGVGFVGFGPGGQFLMSFNKFDWLIHCFDP
jgi:uncharacterized membrane protein (DUF441 family)